MSITKTIVRGLGELGRCTFVFTDSFNMTYYIYKYLERHRGSVAKVFFLSFKIDSLNIVGSSQNYYASTT